MSQHITPDLLTLPLELRQIILSEVIGLHKYVCIKRYYREYHEPRLACHACPQETSKLPGKHWTSDKIRWPHDLRETLLVCMYPHKRCRLDPIDGLPNFLTLLVLNHQLHAEVSQLVYSTTTFAFDRTLELYPFEQALSSNQRWAIHQIHLSITRFGMYYVNWAMVIAALPMFYGLQSLRLSFDICGGIYGCSAAGVCAMIKVTRAAVTICLTGYARIRDKDCECGEWSADQQDDFADEVWHRITNPTKPIEGGRHSGNRMAKQGKYVLWAPIEREDSNITRIKAWQPGRLTTLEERICTLTDQSDYISSIGLDD